MDIIETFLTCFFTDKFDAVNHAIQAWEIFKFYFMYRNELFSDETWHPVYLELGINFKILFQSQTIMGLGVVAES